MLLLLAGAIHAQTTPGADESTSVNPGAAHPVESHHAARAYFGQDIFVAPGQQIGKATCVFCSVQVEGDVAGDVLVLFGNLTVSGHIDGNSTVISGNTVVDSQARIAGRTTVIGGNAVYEADDTLSGNAYVLGGHISSFAGHASPQRRVSISPLVSTAIALVALLLLASLLFPRRSSQ